MKKEIAVALPVLAVFGALAWLGGRSGSDPYRWALAGFIVVLALAVGWRWRSRLWGPPVALLVGAFTLFAVFLTSPAANLAIFEGFAGKALVWCGLASLSSIFVRAGLPRAQQATQATGVLVLGGVLSVAMLATSLVWWLEAVETNMLPKNTVVRTGADIEAAWRTPWGKRHRGIFAVGVIDGERKPDVFVAYISGPGPGGSNGAPALLPLFISLRMADGARVDVRGITSVRGAYGWPECGPRLWQRCLRQGDPVVIWADPGHNRAMSGGKVSSALNEVRVIAYGNLESFRSGYLARAVATARVFGWIGLASIPLSVIPVLLAFLHFRRLRQTVA